MRLSLPSLWIRAGLVAAGWIALSSAAGAAVNSAWKMVWSDEFSAPVIDRSKWEFEVNALGGYNNELQYYTDRSENARIEEGCLVIEARAEVFTGPGGTRNYTSARMRTLRHGDWKYGRIEVRARLPRTQGLWPAIWMLPTESAYGGWPHSGEIDLMELLGHQPAKVYGTLHYADAKTGAHLSSGTSYSLPNGTFSDDFHVFALEWSADAMRWYVDDVLYQTQTSWQTDGAAFPAPFDQTFHLLLNVAVGGDWPRNPDTTTVFPQRMVVDYVRIFTPAPVSLAPPTVTVQPVGGSVGRHGNVTLSVVAAGGPPLSYRWSRNGLAVDGGNAAILSLTDVASSAGGTYAVQVTNPYGQVTSSSAQLVVTDDPAAAATAPLVNLSSRGLVGTGGDVLIAGFVVDGPGAKKLLIRGVGPSLSTYGVTDVLADPVLTLTKPSGELIAANDDWALSGDAPQLEATMRASTFPLIAQGNDAAMIVALPAGGYTAILSGAGNSSGVGLAELYDLEPNSSAHLLNLSVRGRVGTDDGIMIAGFAAGGSGSRSVLVRAIGPTLAGYGVTDPLLDPALQLSTLSGTVLAANANWSDDPAEADAISETGNGQGAFPLVRGSKDAALIAAPPSGACTAMVSGAGRMSGVALVEVYALR